MNLAIYRQHAEKKKIRARPMITKTPHCTKMMKIWIWYFKHVLLFFIYICACDIISSWIKELSYLLTIETNG